MLLRVALLALSMQMSACFSLAAAGPMSTRPQMATKPVAVQMLGFKKDAAVESAESPLASILAQRVNDACECQPVSAAILPVCERPVKAWKGCACRQLVAALI